MTPAARDLRRTSRADLARLMAGGAAFDPAALAGHLYYGLSLGLPRLIERLTWVQFAKAFVRSRDGARLHGWNVRMAQDGADRPWRRLERRGRPIEFGPFQVVTDAGGHVVLDYGLSAARRGLPSPLALARDPLVSLRPGTADLLLGRTLLAAGPVRLATPAFFVLERGETLSPDRLATSSRTLGPWQT